MHTLRLTTRRDGRQPVLTAIPGRDSLRLFDTTRFNAGATLTHGYASNTRDGRAISSEKP